ncbi:hypothetical protein A2165_02735 [Candidatus Curtissbacteria bacterium RBG_13_40_7]|uniref:Glycosyltransferase 2-like domain-containing protein n=1 Tax=Candidatus Curtissbacteria bacterium RBG_13_40_7 TaxID=1797706 RepID=A0A1F5FV71_9BACT|nr:MAG: hypothetical protein A2165_02735 [Candidatus Curtissbacteria bacterium RBG_13_40_7]
MKISALILTLNEEEMIKDCLKQLDFVDEIIVLDQNSSDKTVNIAKKYGAKVNTSKFSSFDKNRNMLKDLAQGQWLLYVDADERLTKESKIEIKNAIKNNQYSAFYFPRKNYILGKWVKHGGWWPDYTPRLFKKDKLKKWQGKVHESPLVSGNFGYFRHPINHLSGRNLSQMFSKSIKWAKIEAQLLKETGYTKVNILSVLKLASVEFIRRFLIKAGFLDGTVGLIEAIYQALHQAMVLTYLWEMRHIPDKNFKKT